jgi:hypothetical protein
MNEYYEESLSIEDYINYDNDYDTEAISKLEEIAAIVLNNEEEKEEKEEEIIHIKTSDALKSCLNLLTYIQQEQDPKFIVNNHILDSLQELKKNLMSQKFKEAKQTSLESYIY